MIKKSLDKKDKGHIPKDISLTVFANVDPATHGETVTEVLGSGDESQTYQQFTLKQMPLTHMSASTPNGTESTLEVRVNDLSWKEVPAFYGCGPDEHIYITHVDDKGRTTIQFGDGQTGARLPTGKENVKATYRKAIGFEGNANRSKKKATKKPVQKQR